MMTGMVTAVLIAMVTGVNSVVNNMHTSFGLVVVGLLLITSVISLTGIGMVRERHHAERDKEENVKITDIFKLLKENDAIRINVIAALFSGFIWTFLFATMLYYIKWGFCADLSTGVVDNGKYALYSGIASMLMFIPLLGGTLIAAPIMKKIGDPMKFLRILLLAQAIPCGILFLLQILGVLEKMPWLFLLCVAVTTTAVGMGYIPGSTVDIEIMDYEIYKNGKDRSGLCNALNRFISKAQNAIGASVVGFMLAGIGYVVDSETGDFAGELSQMPVMLNWFIVIMGLIPFVLGIIAYLIERRYPITNEVRAQMRESLHKAEEN
jgi:Na+/melibiose symporter-like transporter